MKFIRIITNNWGLKLASLAAAAILWFLVTNINDPVNTVRFSNVAVTFRNTDIITDAGEIYEVLDDTDTIGTVTITAPRSIADSFSKDNIVAVADFEDMGDDNTIPIQLSVSKYSSDVDSISSSVSEVKLSIENLASSTLALEATTSGTLADGYIVSGVSTEQNQVRISGPQSVIDKVAKASVDVDVTGFTSNIGTDVNIKLYDSDGKEIKNDSITMNMTSVRVNVTILATKTVPIAYHTTGEPADGFMLTGTIESTPDTLMIAGKSSVLNDVEEIDITDALDVDGLTSDLKTTVELEDYLPSGISFGDSDFNGVASVVVDISPVATQTITLDEDDITYDNVPENYTVVLGDGSEDTTHTVAIQGMEDVVSKVTPANLNAVIDLSSLTANLSDGESLASGTYTVALKFSPPDGVTVADTVRVQIKVTAPEEDDSSSSATSASTGT